MMNMVRATLVVTVGTALAGCSDPTRYARGYNENVFLGLPIGVNSNEVIRLLGEPLQVSQQSYYERWCYSSGKPSVQQNLLSSTQWNPAPRLVLFFSEDGKVNHQYGATGDAIGLSKSEAISRMGTPDTKETNTFAIIFSYSESETSDSHHVRAILFDQNGVLIEKKAFFYKD